MGAPLARLDAHGAAGSLHLHPAASTIFGKGARCSA